jgi:hypothetical protein
VGTGELVADAGLVRALELTADDGAPVDEEAAVRGVPVGDGALDGGRLPVVEPPRVPAVDADGDATGDVDEDAVRSPAGGELVARPVPSGPGPADDVQPASATASSRPARADRAAVEGRHRVTGPP